MLVSTDHANPRPRASERMAAPIAERTGPRRSPAWLLVCLLAVVTALLCYQVAASTVPPALPPPPPDRLAAAHVAVVSRFYAAVNTTLRTGDPAPLEALVAAELIAHPGFLDGPSGRAGLISHLLDLRVLYPDLQLRIADLQATTADQVTARIQVAGVDSGAFLGLPVPAGVPIWPALEAFRLEGELIVERWTGTEAAVDLDPLFEITQLAPSSGTAYLQVVRVTYPPHSTVPLGTEQTPRLTYLEAGTLTVPDTRGAGSNADAWRNTIEVAAGSLLPAEPGLSAMVREDEAAAVLEVTITGSAPNVINPIPERTVNVQATVLASTLVAVPDWPGMEVAVGQVSVAPGATVAFPPASGPILLVVEHGDLELTAGAGDVAEPGSWMEAAGTNRAAAPNQVPIQTGRIALVRANAPSLWHNPGSQPATVLVLVIAPRGEGPTGVPATPATVHL